MFLRFIGIMNAAVWFGASVFFTFAVASAFFTPQMKHLFGEAYTGIIAQQVVERYYVLYYWCGPIALLHQLAEWVYLGRALQRLTLIALAGAFCLGLIGGLGLQPKVNRLHQVKYGRNELYTPAQKAQATKSLKLWHGVAVAANYLALAGLALYVWRVANPSGGPRFVPASKFRS